MKTVANIVLLIEVGVALWARAGVPSASLISLADKKLRPYTFSTP
jgi:hypothetical protein